VKTNGESFTIQSASKKKRKKKVERTTELPETRISWKENEERIHREQETGKEVVNENTRALLPYFEMPTKAMTGRELNGRGTCARGKEKGVFRSAKKNLNPPEGRAGPRKGR